MPSEHLQSTGSELVRMENLPLDVIPPSATAQQLINLITVQTDILSRTAILEENNPFLLVRRLEQTRQNVMAIIEKAEAAAREEIALTTAETPLLLPDAKMHIARFMKLMHFRLHEYMRTANTLVKQLPSAQVDVMAYKRDLQQRVREANVPAADQQVTERSVHTEMPIADRRLGIFGQLSTGKKVETTAVQHARPSEPESGITVEAIIGALDSHDVHAILTEIYGYDEHEDRYTRIIDLLTKKEVSDSPAQLQEAAALIAKHLTDMAKGVVPDPYRRRGGAMVSIGLLPEMDVLNGRTEKGSHAGPERVQEFAGPVQLRSLTGTVREVYVHGLDELLQIVQQSALHDAKNVNADGAVPYYFDGAEIMRMFRFLARGEILELPAKNGIGSYVLWRDHEGYLRIGFVDGDLPTEFQEHTDREVQSKVLADPLHYVTINGARLAFQR